MVSHCEPCDCDAGGIQLACSGCGTRKLFSWHRKGCDAAIADLDGWLIVTAKGQFKRVRCRACLTERGQRRAIPTALKRAVIARDGFTCQLCKRPVRRRKQGEKYAPDLIQLDHIKGWADGGEHQLDNLRVACADCNLRRGGCPSLDVR